MRLRIHVHEMHLRTPSIPMKPPYALPPDSKFGELTVVADEGCDAVKVRCSCGSELFKRRSELKQKTAVRCPSCTARIRSGWMTTHGESRSRLYRIWRLMMFRCESEKCPMWRYYGGKGVTVCSAWKTYLLFRSWAHSNGYAPDLSIDRKDTNGNYSPENCRWATDKEQAANRSTTRTLLVEGTRLTALEAAPRLNCSARTLQKYAWRAEKKNKKSFTVKGATVFLA